MTYLSMLLTWRNALWAGFGRINVIFLRLLHVNALSFGSSPFQSRECLCTAIGTGCHHASPPAVPLPLLVTGPEESFLDHPWYSLIQKPSPLCSNSDWIQMLTWHHVDEKMLALAFTTEAFQDGLTKYFCTTQNPCWSRWLLISVSFWEVHSI